MAKLSGSMAQFACSQNNCGVRGAMCLAQRRLRLRESHYGKYKPLCRKISVKYGDGLFWHYEIASDSLCKNDAFINSSPHLARSRRFRYCGGERSCCVASAHSQPATFWAVSPDSRGICRCSAYGANQCKNGGQFYFRREERRIGSRAQADRHL